MNPKLMKPEASSRFLDSMNVTMSEFIERLRQLKAEASDTQSVRQLPFEINKFTMEGEVLLSLYVQCLTMLTILS
jgi:hypothetical protein